MKLDMDAFQRGFQEKVAYLEQAPATLIGTGVGGLLGGGIGALTAEEGERLKGALIGGGIGAGVGGLGTNLAYKPMMRNYLAGKWSDSAKHRRAAEAEYDLQNPKPTFDTGTSYPAYHSDLENWVDARSEALKELRGEHGKTIDDLLEFEGRYYPEEKWLYRRKSTE